MSSHFHIKIRTLIVDRCLTIKKKNKTTITQMNLHWWRMKFILFNSFASSMFEKGGKEDDDVFIFNTENPFCYSITIFLFNLSLRSSNTFNMLR